MFHSGSFIVFPSIAEDSTFIFRHLADTLLLSYDPFPDKHFLSKALTLLTVVLALSDELAHRAGLSGEKSLALNRPMEVSLFLAHSTSFRYKQAVSFDLTELASFLQGIVCHSVHWNH